MKNSYSSIINSYIEKLKEQLKNNLEMIYIIGSSATEDVVVNWSDIDTIIVLKEYNYDNIEKIRQAGADIAVVGTAIINSDNYKDTIQVLKSK